VFKQEQAEYVREGIDWSYIEFVDNQDVLDLVEKRPGGVIDNLDEACRFPRATASDFVDKLCSSKIVSESPRFTRARRLPNGFTVEHYAGAVTYTADHFLGKNRDFVVAEHEQLVQGSGDAFVAALFPKSADAADGDENSSSNSSSARSSYRFSSVASRFKAQLADLMAALAEMEPHYVRCVKPNGLNSPALFEPAPVLHQLRCGGVLEAVRISCAGFPAKIPYADFVDHFWALAPSGAAAAAANANANASSDDDVDAAAARAIVSAAGLSSSSQAGKTKVFLRAGGMARLERLRTDALNAAAVTLQRHARGFVARRRAARARRAVVICQAYTRGFLARRATRELRAATSATKIQAAWRAHSARQSFLRARGAAVVVQAHWRGNRSRIATRDLLSWRAATAIQAAWRGARARRNLSKWRRAALAAQCAWRCKQARKVLRRRRAEARDTGKLVADKANAEARLAETTKVLEQVTRQRNEMKSILKEEKIAREQALASAKEAAAALEAARAKAARDAEAASEAAASELAALRDAVEQAKAEAEQARAAAAAARAAAAAEAISAAQKVSAAERARLEAESKAAAAKEDLMTRLANAVKQRDAAREEALVATEKLAKLEEDVSSGAVAVAARGGSAAAVAAGGALVAASFSGGGGNALAVPQAGATATLSEVDRRQRELYTKQQLLLREQRTADQEKLLAALASASDLGFTPGINGGAPFAAVLVFRCCLQWRAFGADRTSLFDRLIGAMGAQIERRQDDNDALAHWLATTVTLLHLLQRNIKPASGGAFSARIRGANGGGGSSSSALGSSSSPVSRSFFGSRGGAFSSFFSRAAGVATGSGSPMGGSYDNGGSNISPEGRGLGGTGNGVGGRGPASALDASIHAGAAGGFRPVEAKYPALLFKQQLDAFVQKIFPLLRDNVKKEIAPQLAACVHAPRAGPGVRRRNAAAAAAAAAVAAPGANAPASTAASLSSAASSSLSPHWGAVLGAFDRTLITLQRAHVPRFLSRALFRQLAAFVNVQLFNQLLLRRECCSFSNGEYVKTGLAEVEAWVTARASEVEGGAGGEGGGPYSSPGGGVSGVGGGLASDRGPWVSADAWEALRPIRQAVTFLVIHQKHRKSLEEITTELCPGLSVQQLYRISTMYWDDRYGTETVSAEVLAAMKGAMMVGNSSQSQSANNGNDAAAAAAAAAAHSFLLDDDSSIPFTAEDVANRVDDGGLYGELPVPACLADGGSFDFLRRDLRRGGSSTTSNGAGAAASSSPVGSTVTPPGLPRAGGAAAAATTPAGVGGGGGGPSPLAPPQPPQRQP